MLFAALRPRRSVSVHEDPRPTWTIPAEELYQLHATFSAVSGAGGGWVP